MIVRQSTQTLLTRVPETTMEEFDQAVDAASQAFKSWSKQSVIARQRFAIESVFEYPPYQRLIHLRCIQTSVSNSPECRRTCTQHCPRAGKDPCRYIYFSVFLVSSLITPQMLMVMSSVVFKSSKVPSPSRLTLSARNLKVCALLCCMVVVFTPP
jgi:hypothetical protein